MFLSVPCITIINVSNIIGIRYPPFKVALVENTIINNYFLETMSKFHGGWKACTAAVTNWNLFSNPGFLDRGNTGDMMLIRVSVKVPC